MRTVGAFEAKTHFSSLLEKVTKGEQVLITRHGHPVAKLIPTSKPDREEIKQAVQQIKQFSQKHKLEKLPGKNYVMKANDHELSHSLIIFLQRFKFVSTKLDLALDTNLQSLKLRTEVYSIFDL